MMTPLAIVCIIGLVLGAAVLVFALYYKGDVKAGGRIGKGAFFIEATKK